MIQATSIEKSISKDYTFLPPFIISKHYIGSLQKQTTYSFIVKADTPTVHDVENKKSQSLFYEWGKFEIPCSELSLLCGKTRIFGQSECKVTLKSKLLPLCIFILFIFAAMCLHNHRLVYVCFLNYLIWCCAGSVFCCMFLQSWREFQDCQKVPMYFVYISATLPRAVFD